MNILNKYKVEIILAAVIVAFIAVFSHLAIERYKNLWSHYYDLGIMNQVVFNTSRGWWLEMTNQDFQRNLSRFAIHFDPLMAIFAPIYLFYPSPSILLVGQVIFVGFGAVGVYLLALNLTKEKLASLFFAVIYLWYFPVQRAILFDFHSVVLATPLLIFAVYFSLTRRYSLALLCIVTSLLAKEHVGLVTALLGLYLVFFKKEYQFGTIVTVLSLLFFFTTFFYIIPDTRQAEHFALRYIKNEGGIKNVSTLFAKDRFEYLSMLLLPEIVLAIFSPIPLLLASPELGINLLSSNGNLRSFFFHYNSLIVVFVFWAMIAGYVQMKKNIKAIWLQRTIVGVFILLFIHQIYLFGPLPDGLVRYPQSPFPKISKEKDEAIQYWQGQLKDPLTPVAATPRLAPFFTNRRYYYDFLYDPKLDSMTRGSDDIINDLGKYQKAQYVVINKEEIPLDRPTSTVNGYYRHLINNPGYRKIYDQAEIEVYKKN